jgi:hypothetical protein
VVYTLVEVIVSNLSSKLLTSLNNCSPAKLQSVTQIAPSLVATEAEDKNPAKLARGSLLIPTTWRNIKYEITYEGRLIRMRPIEAINLREKNYPDYNPHYDYWEKMLNKDFPLRQTS